MSCKFDFYVKPSFEAFLAQTKKPQALSKCAPQNMQSVRYFCSILTNTGMFRYHLVSVPFETFHENVFSGSPLTVNGLQYRRIEANRRAHFGTLSSPSCPRNMIASSDEFSYYCRRVCRFWHKKYRLFRRNCGRRYSCLNAGSSHFSVA